MPKLFKALGNWVRAKDEEAAKAMSDPVRDSRFAIDDSKKQIGEFTGKIASLIAENKRIGRDAASAEAEVDKFDEIARRAAASSEEDDVRSALERRQTAQERLTTLRSEVERNASLITQLRNQLNQARAKVAAAESNLTRLNARLEGAKVRQELAKASSAFNTGDSPLAALDDLERQVDETETEAEAWEEISTDAGAEEGKALEEKYGSGSSSDVDDEVAKMMAAAKKPSGGKKS
jgi:phage shock protein A